jgi:hypothetical protein
MAVATLTPLQLIAGASLLQNQGLSVSPELSDAIDVYSNTAVMTAFFDALALDGSLATLAANTVPAFSNSLPAAYANLGTQMSNVVLTQAAADFAGGDISKFIQALNLVEAYAQNTNLFINSAVNSQTYLGNTFTSTNNMITGDVTTINLSTTDFGTDLVNLGGLIDLSDLADLGSPLSLIQRLVELTGNIPVLSLLLLLEGVSEDVVLRLTDPTLSVADSVQRLMYQAMTKITGSDLAQILKLLKITTDGIDTMADLLNPVKLFPGSYLSLTVTTSNGIRAVYLNSSGAVNTKLELELPDYVIASYQRLSQIIPADQALANKALAVALGQINGLSAVNLPTFAETVKNLETTRDLPLITALTTAVPPAVANYFTSTLAVGGGTNGDIRVTDVIGLAGGWIATDAYTQTVEIFATMDLTTLTLIYDTMYHALNGDYGDTGLGPLTIPGGRPCAGTYNGIPDTIPNPNPPPPDITVYNPSAVGLAMACLTGSALTEINNLQTSYPNQTAQLNTLWNSMAAQVVLEDTLQPLIKLNYADLTANDRNSIYGFIYNLPSYGTQTEEGGIAWFLEAMADLSTQGGEAIIACLREGRNQVFLNSSGIYTNTRIPGDPIPPPPEAELLPSTYTEAEAANLVIK